ncbi:sulfite oxidase heme-binding subunit YedZ [Chitinibacter tainanensis]|uniref:sulfite oxidase heme-binding subunit YedZ n=1 Tax=Chitinibacter tainanensis TaxID=230667 RepID=UPI002355E9A8|nr:protein-methionine-sulfoxide reductase heme-binding subunit MsrQ [Chitinibacter tainanensis]
MSINHDLAGNTPLLYRCLQHKACWWLLLLTPLLRMVWLVLQGELVNPIEFITHSTGTWALSLLCATLAITPLRQLSGWAGWQRYRRLLGLFAFFYACLHWLTYLWLDQFFALDAIVADLVKRPFILLGMLAFTLLLPLAITSTQGWMRRLKRRWGQLHQLVYPAALLGVLHYLWLVKRDLTTPLLFATGLALLLGWRLWRWVKPRWGGAG